MVNFFKNFGKGILYVILFPLILVVVCLYSVFGIFVFFFQFVKMIILFFSGRTLFSDFEEDIAAKAILKQMSPSLDQDDNDEKEEENNQLSLYPSDSSVYGSEYSSSFMEQKKEEPAEVEEEEDVE